MPALKGKLATTNHAIYRKKGRRVVDIKGEQEETLEGQLGDDGVAGLIQFSNHHQCRGNITGGRWWSL